MGGTSGFYCSIEPIDLNDAATLNVLHPANTRLNRIVPITIQYGNAGNVDIPIPLRFINSLANAPLADNPAVLGGILGQFATSLFLEFLESGGPPGILRPGATGSMTVYTKAVAPLRFVIQQ